MPLPDPGVHLMTQHTEWPASPLQAAGRAFDLLTTGPAAPIFDGTAVPGVHRKIDLTGLRRLLLSPRTTAPERDAIWRVLVELARPTNAAGRTWTVLAVGLALPGLTRIAGTMARGWPGDPADLDAEILAGFLLRLRTLDTAGQRVLGRLLDAATRAGRRAREDAADGQMVRVSESWSTPPTEPWAHPDWVLARAVAAGVLDLTEAQLIGATRLEDVTVAQAAEALDIATRAALALRRRAEARLVAALASGELDHVTVPAPPGRRCLHRPSGPASPSRVQAGRMRPSVMPTP
jgi:hypothetical protein